MDAWAPARWPPAGATGRGADAGADAAGAAAADAQAAATALRQLAQVVQDHRELLDQEIADFFRNHDRHWAALPAPWRDAWVRQDAVVRERCLLAPTATPTAWPEDLRAFGAAAAAATLPRQPADALRQAVQDAYATRPIDPELLVGMKEKKQHEVRTAAARGGSGCRGSELSVTSTVLLCCAPPQVTIMAAAIATVAAEHQVPLVVDLGAGQAHLSHILAYHFGLDVLAVDNDASQTSGALRRQARASKRAAKLQGAVKLFWLRPTAALGARG